MTKNEFYDTWHNNYPKVDDFVKQVLLMMPFDIGRRLNYLCSCLDQRLATGIGSVTGYTERGELYRDLVNAHWTPYVHENIAEGCEAFITYDIAGYLGVIDLNDVPDETIGTFRDYKNTGTLSLVIEGYPRQYVNYTVLIIGPDDDEAGDNRPIVYTFHPGAPLRASEFKVGSVEEGGSGFKDGDKITVGEAKKLGFIHAKVG